jgi:class 3 adenylate cyclase
VSVTAGPADIAGYSRLVEADEEGTLSHWKALWGTVIEPNIKEHRGRIVRVIGDGILAEFASVIDAVSCAVEVQRSMAAAASCTVTGVTEVTWTARCVEAARI